MPHCTSERAVQASCRSHALVLGGAGNSRQHWLPNVPHIVMAADRARMLSERWQACEASHVMKLCTAAELQGRQCPFRRHRVLPGKASKYWLHPCCSSMAATSPCGASHIAQAGAHVLHVHARQSQQPCGLRQSWVQMAMARKLAGQTRLDAREGRLNLNVRAHGTEHASDNDIRLA